MNTLKNFLSLFLLVGFSWSCSHVPRRESKYDHIIIVGTNDFHGYLRPQTHNIESQTLIQGGAALFAGHIKILDNKYPESVLLLDAGDLFQGTLESNAFLGQSTLDYYNSLPYRAAAIGNHEFDYGPLRLQAILKDAKFVFLSANLLDKKTGESWTAPNFSSSTMIQPG